MENFKLHISDLILLKIILDHDKDIFFQKLYLEIKKQGNFLKNPKTLSKKLLRLRNLGLIETFRTKSRPAYSKHKIAKKGIELIEDFNKTYPIKETREIPQKTIIEYKGLKKLKSDELANLTQSVVYYLLEVLGKEYEQISKEKNLKLQNIAEKIVEEVRES